ncbi:hypothetical protein HN682_01385 [Candidatus Peregrinibacteria bacterium]|nr:hypothetical protein [Candidatus Scalindua sp.]MBT7350498.1 hypothetical protein [candidate division WWE3 bacterium]MBT7928558.1 hypothetical protein [Candidatus Peregrinibacteria bacterium]
MIFLRNKSYVCQMGDAEVEVYVDENGYQKINLSSFDKYMPPAELRNFLGELMDITCIVESKDNSGE